jgi:hypothetical protein
MLVDNRAQYIFIKLQSQPAPVKPVHLPHGDHHHQSLTQTSGDSRHGVSRLSAVLKKLSSSLIFEMLGRFLAWNSFTGAPPSLVPVKYSLAIL